MKVVFVWLQVMIVMIGLASSAITFVSIGLDWKRWVLLGVSAYSFCMWTLVISLWWMYHKVTADDAKLEREKKKLEVQKLRDDMAWNNSMLGQLRPRS